MNGVSTLIIPLAFILLAAILLWFIISAKGKWWIKALLLICVPAFGISVWGSLDSYLGWPTVQKTPERFILLWTEVVEPQPGDESSGVVYMWTRTLEEGKNKPGAFDYKPSADEPRAFKVPYSKKLHRGMDIALQMIREGKVVVIEPPKDAKDGEGEGGMNNPSGFADNEGEFRVYELPPIVLPPKY